MRPPGKVIGILVVLVFIAAVALLTYQFVQPSLPGLMEPAPLTEPIVREIAADRGWQNTGILLQAGETIEVQFLSGEIRDGESILRGPAGTGYICGDVSCCEPMFDVPRDALIGRVRDSLILIGDTNAMDAPGTGELQLRINDCDDGLYDNSGSLKIRISPESNQP